MNIKTIYILLALTLLSACSTTKKIADGDVLYTGIKHLQINESDSSKLNEDVKDLLDTDIDVRPNASLMSPYYTHPFPIGLWVYNWDITPKSGSIKKWLFKKLSREPVLVSTVRPELRTQMMLQTLKRNGYFNSSSSYELVYDKKDKKKAKIKYSVSPGNAYRISKIESGLPDTVAMSSTIDSLVRINKYLSHNSRYCVDSLLAVRSEITDFLRRKGYYYFKEDYLEYLADSTIENEQIALRIQYSTSIPVQALVRYKTRSVTTYIKRYQGGGTPDTLHTTRGELIVMRPMRLRKNTIPSCITFRKGKTVSTRDFSRTQSYLSRLGIFRSVNIDITPIDSLKQGEDSLDIAINCILDAPLEASLKFSGSYKSSSYIGPGVSAGITHSNVFGGGEQFSIDLSASYEWQIGKNNNSASNNYYEFGLNTALTFPRLLAPKFIARTKRDINWSKISLGANIYNDPSTIRYLQVNAALTYEWHTNRYSLHQLDLPKLTFSKRLKEQNLDSDNTGSSLMALELINPTDFIPKISYTYRFERSFGKHSQNNLVASFSITESGNILSGIWGLAGSKNEPDNKKLFGVPFSQFVRLQSQMVFSHQFLPDHRLVARFLIGAGFPFGNSDMLPYGEDFTSGGPSSIRAFSIRSLGPGRFSGYDSWITQYLRSGSFKLELNAEYRFPIFSFLKGAVFADMGNVWLIEDPLGIYGGEGTLEASKFLNDIALGTGLGLRVDLDMIVVRADLGIGIHAPYNTGKSGYYNMTSFKKSLMLNFAIGYPF